MMYYGRSGYVEATKKIVETHQFIERGQAIFDNLYILLLQNFSWFSSFSLRQIKGIRVMGHPEACCVAVDSIDFNIYRVSDAMTKKGWSLSPLQFPSR